MNIFTSNLKTSFVLPTTMCPPQKMQFHHSASPLKNLIENKVLSAQNPCRSFKNPNFFNQNTHGEKFPSSYRKINHFEVAQVEDADEPLNSSGMVAEKTDFGREVVLDSPKPMCSRKRARKSKDKTKLPEKHNTKRQVLHEMMDLDFSNDSIDISQGEDQEMVESHLNTLKLCDMIILPTHSAPVCVPSIDISVCSSKIPTQTTCFAFSISPPTARQRQVSTTESEDSFIIFDSGTDEECDFSDDSGSESDEHSNQDDSEDESNSDSPGSVIPSKKVRFADDKELCEIHPMVKWSFAYQAARKGPWEVYARDRERFKNRIRLVGEKIGQCFEPEHRQKVYDQRFKENFEE